MGGRTYAIQNRKPYQTGCCAHTGRPDRRSRAERQPADRQIQVLSLCRLPRPGAGSGRRPVRHLRGDGSDGGRCRRAVGERGERAARASGRSGTGRGHRGPSGRRFARGDARRSERGRRPHRHRRDGTAPMPGQRGQRGGGGRGPDLARGFDRLRRRRQSLPGGGFPPHGRGGAGACRAGRERNAVGLPRRTGHRHRHPGATLQRRRGLHPPDRLRHRRRGRAGGAASGGHPRLGRDAAGNGKHAPGKDLSAVGRKRRNAGVRRRAGGAVAGHRRPHRPLPPAGRGGGAGRGDLGAFDRHFPLRTLLCPHVALRRGRRADGPFPDRGRLRAALGALSARNALLRACRRHAPRLALGAAGSDGRRRGRAAGGLGDVFPRRGRGEKLCRRAVHRRRLRAGGAGAPLPLPAGQRPASARKSVLPQNGSYGREERPAAAAADRAGGAGRGGAGDAAVRRGPARRTGSWQRRGAALRPGRRIRA